MLKIKKTFTLVSIIISLICFSLSIWQVKRLEWKKNLISNIEKAYNSDSININVLSGDLRNFKFKNVYLEGTFINEKSMFLGHLITPFLLKDGRYILTNRGWLKEIIKIREPNKEYLIKGILKESDIKNIFTPKNNMEKNLWFYISTDEMSKFAGLRLVDNIFVDLIGSNPNHKLTIINSSTPKIVNNHLQYAITWAILGLLFLVMNYIYSKRH